MLYSIKTLKLWWPRWSRGITVTGYGFEGNRYAYGDGYRFKLDTDCDSWLCPDGKLMPVENFRLVNAKGEKIVYTSFAIINNNNVQINYAAAGELGFAVKFLPTEDVFFTGETFDNDVLPEENL